MCGRSRTAVPSQLGHRARSRLLSRGRRGVTSHDELSGEILHSGSKEGIFSTMLDDILRESEEEKPERGNMLASLDDTLSELPEALEEPEAT